MDILIILLLIGILVILFLADSQPPTSEQLAENAKGAIRREKEEAMAKTDAITAVHKRAMFDVVYQANKQAVEEAASEARAKAVQAVERATEEV